MDEPTLEQMLAFKLALCQEFAGNNQKLGESLYEQNILIYTVGYPNGEMHIHLDTEYNFPLNMQKYQDIAAEAYNKNGLILTQIDYWRT
jgi:hypothetical protein